MRNCEALKALDWLKPQNPQNAQRLGRVLSMKLFVYLIEGLIENAAVLFLCFLCFCYSRYNSLRCCLACSWLSNSPSNLFLIAKESFRSKITHFLTIC